MVRVLKELEARLMLEFLSLNVLISTTSGLRDYIIFVGSAKMHNFYEKGYGSLGKFSESSLQ